MRVFVKNLQGEPLMPTHPRKARLLLKEGKGKVVGRDPFTIQLLYATGENQQDITLGVDAGYAQMGFSAVSQKAELISGEVELLKGMSERLKERAMYRTNRRRRKRHRQPRFDNRGKSKGWLAPSIQHKFNAHLKMIEKVKQLLPINKIIIEVAAFDIQQIKNPAIVGKGYQQGEQLGFGNVRAYVLHRDNHQCQNPSCKNKAKNKMLEVHHIGYWKKDRSDRPINLITLCDQCHTPRNHKPGNMLWGWQPQIKSFRPETFMSTVRWRLVNTLGALPTFGHITKQKRIESQLPKTHFHDGFLIAQGKTEIERTEPIFFKQKRKNNRSLEKFYDAKIIDIRTGEKVSGGELSSGRRTRNKNLNGENLRQYRGEKISKGRRSIRKQRYSIQPGDLVQFEGIMFRAIGIQNKGAYLKMTDGKKPIVKNITSIETIFHEKTLMIA